MGFPKKIHPLYSKQPRVICPGIAKMLDLPVTGRRDMSGAIATTREDEYCSGTSPILAAAFQSNTDVQCPYRVPLCDATHETDCPSKACISSDPKEIKKLCRKVQRAQKNISGYFGGYIGKSQPIGVYELKKSIATLPFLKQKLLERQSKPSHQLAHTVNRMFTTLESKGIFCVQS